MTISFQDIKALHMKYAPNQEVFDLVFTHCLIVRDIAQSLMIQNPKLEINKKIVTDGALLHDIGVYGLYNNGEFDKANYITHGVRGDILLQLEGLDKRLSNIASHHTGVGLTKRDIRIQALPLPDKDFLAETIEERLVMYADKFHSKNPQFNRYETYLNIISKFGPHKVDTFRILKDEFGVPDLDFLVEKYGHPIF